MTPEAFLGLEKIRLVDFQVGDILVVSREEYISYEGMIDDHIESELGYFLVLESAKYLNNNSGENQVSLKVFGDDMQGNKELRTFCGLAREKFYCIPGCEHR